MHSIFTDSPSLHSKTGFPIVCEIRLRNHHPSDLTVQIDAAPTIAEPVACSIALVRPGETHTIYTVRLLPSVQFLRELRERIMPLESEPST